MYSVFNRHFSGMIKAFAHYLLLCGGMWCFLKGAVAERVREKQDGSFDEQHVNALLHCIDKISIIVSSNIKKMNTGKQKVL